MTAGRKRDVVLRLLRGEPLALVARELAVTAADLSGWRNASLDAGSAGLKSRPRDARDKTIEQLRTKVGELTLDTELLQTKIARLEAGGGPFERGGRSDEHRHLDLRTGRRYGVARVCRLWGVARASLYRGAGVRGKRRPHRRAGPGPQGRCRRQPGGGDPAGAHGQPLSWRRLSQGLGATAPWRAADVEGAGPPADARERPRGGRPGRVATTAFLQRFELRLPHARSSQAHPAGSPRPARSRPRRRAGRSHSAARSASPTRQSAQVLRRAA